MGEPTDPLPSVKAPQTRALVQRALDGDAEATQTLIRRMAPVVHVRVARAMARRRHESKGRDTRADLEDLVQEVFAAIFAKEGKTLRAWDPERGLSFENFVGLVAEREVASILRSGRRNPWTEDPTMDTKLQAVGSGAPSPEARAVSKDTLEVLLARLRERLSPLGNHYFQLLFVEQRSVAEVAEASSATPDALYAWRSRLSRMVRSLAEELSAEEEAL